MTQPGDFSKRHVNAVLALVTATLDGPETGDTSNPVALEAIGAVIRDVPRDVEVLAFIHLVQLLVRQLARVQGRPVPEVWQEMALHYAKGWPEDGGV